MKIKQLKEQLNGVPSDYDVELFFGHASFPVSSINVATFGKSVAIHADTDARLDEAEDALGQIYMLCGHCDPSDGEGTSPKEVVEAVKEMLTIRRKKSK